MGSSNKKLKFENQKNEIRHSPRRHRQRQRHQLHCRELVERGRQRLRVRPGQLGPILSRRQLCLRQPMEATLDLLLVPQLLPTTSVCLTTLNNSCTILASNTGILLMLTRAATSTTTSTSTPWPPLPPSTPASSWAPLTVTTTVS